MDKEEAQEKEEDKFMGNFFGEHGRFIKSYAENIDYFEPVDEDEEEKRIKDLMRRYLVIISEDQDYNKMHVFINEFGVNFMKSIHNNDDEENFIKVFCFCGRIAIEKMYRTGLYNHDSEGDILNTFSLRKDFKNNNIQKAIEEEVNYVHPNILKKVILSDLKNINKESYELREMIVKDKEEIEKNILGWKEVLDKDNIMLDNHKSYVENLRNKYNFVGLTKAFEDMEIDKEKEVRNGKVAMVFFGICAILPFVIGIIYNSHRVFVLNNEISLSIDKAIAYGVIIFPLEILLVYFFRISLTNVNSLKSQVLQIKLRRSICSFIQKYIDFSSGYDNAKLEKFESLVFSGLVSDPDKVPSTFDGLDQIVNVIKSVREK